MGMRPNIEKFLKENPKLEFKDSEIGFGRKCVGIIYKATECFVPYETYTDDFETEHKHDVAADEAPDSAYHKGPYLAVLHNGSENGKEEALDDLDIWLGAILKAGYRIEEFEERNTLAALSAGKGRIKQLAIVNKNRFTDDLSNLEA